MRDNVMLIREVSHHRIVSQMTGLSLYRSATLLEKKSNYRVDQTAQIQSLAGFSLRVDDNACPNVRYLNVYLTEKIPTYSTAGARQTLYHKKVSPDEIVDIALDDERTIDDLKEIGDTFYVCAVREDAYPIRAEMRVEWDDVMTALRGFDHESIAFCFLCVLSQTWW